MNVLKRAFLYDTRKKGKSLTLFLLFVLITLFVTISFSVLSATQAAATNLRETVGASFTLRGKPMELSTSGEDYAMQFIPISQHDIDLIAGNTEIKVHNAQQPATAAASSFIFPSGMPSGTVSANTSSAWNRNFTSGILTLAEGRHITQEDQHVALVSRELAEENGLQIGGKLSFKDPAATVEIIGIYESDPSMEFDADTIFTDHNTLWALTESEAGTYSGRVDFFVTDPARLEAVMEQVKRDAPLQWEDYTLQADTAEYDAIAYQLSTIGRLTTLLIVSAIIVSVIVLFLILAMRIRGRVHEVGVLLAVGVAKGHTVLPRSILFLPGWRTASVLMNGCWKRAFEGVIWFWQGIPPEGIWCLHWHCICGNSESRCRQACAGYPLWERWMKACPPERNG